MHKTWFSFVALCLAACLSLSALLLAEAKESLAFDKLRALNGDWHGTVAWTGEPPSGIGAHYYVTGNGSAVVEDLFAIGSARTKQVHGGASSTERALMVAP